MDASRGPIAVPALLSPKGRKGRKSHLAIPRTHFHFSRTVPTTFHATVCAKHQPFCPDLKISFYEPIVVIPETIHQCHLVTR